MSKGKKWRSYFRYKVSPVQSRFDIWRQTAKGLISSKARLRLEWLILYQTKFKHNVALTCRYFGISRKTFYIWLNRFDETNLRSLEDESHVPLTQRTPDYTHQEELRTIELRRNYPTAGRDKMVVLYQDDYGEGIKTWSMRRIIHDRKLFAERAVKNKRQRVQERVLRKKRITDLALKPQTGFMIECDTVVFHDFGLKRYLLTGIDRHSRFAFAYMYRSKVSRNAADFLKRLTLLFGVIDNIHVDNGSEFKKDFETAASSLGVTLYHARPHRAKDKPFIERFNGIVQQEFIDLGHYTTDVDKFNQGLVDWLIYYNFKRPHHSLGLKRPIEFATLHRTEVLPILSPVSSRI